MIACIAAVSLMYVGGMYLNDWKDADFDRQHRPERPIPEGQINRRTVLFYGAGFFALALIISVIMRPEAALWTLGLIGCITAYDLHHKNNPLSPWVMGGCRALIYPWAASVAGHPFSPELWVATASAYIYTLGLTGIARGSDWSIGWGAVFGRCSGKKSRTVRQLPDGIPTKVILSGCVLLPALLWGGVLVTEDQPVGVWLPVMIIFLTWTGLSLRGWFRNPPQIGFAVGNLIAGFALLDLLAVSVAGPFLLSIAALFFLLFIATLKMQRIISGT